jgi:predicted acyl esterase
MSRDGYPDRIKRNPVCLVAFILASCLMLLPSVSLAINHPTSNPYETRPSPDGSLPYLIQPMPPGLIIEKDVMVVMPDGVKLACNVFRPEKAGKFPVILSLTHYGKDQTPPAYNPNGSPVPSSYAPFVLRVHAQGEDVGHMKVSMLTPWEGPDAAYWVPNDYVVVIVDQRGGFN